MRTKKSIRNVMFAILTQICTTLCAFVTRSALIKLIGIQSVSLNGLFTEVISMLSLTELGVGSAIIYNLYKPLAEQDQKKVSQLMNLFEKAYRIIALATFIMGCLLIPWIQLLVNEVDYSIEYIRLVYFLFVIQTASSYSFSYKISLLNADQKKYIHSLINTLVKIIGTVLLVLVLFITKEFILYLICNIGFTLITNIITSCIVDKQYPYIKQKEVLPAEERRQVFKNVKDIFIKTLSSKITNSTDNILISTLVGTLKVGYYSNYALFFNVVRQLEAQFGDGIIGSIGNLMADSKYDHAITVLERLSFIFYVLASLGMLALYCAISPFIELWLGAECVLSDSIVFICCFNVFFDFAKLPLWRFLEVSGLFEKDRNISIIGSASNLVISVILGYKMGMAGIFIGTLFTYVIQLVLKIKLLYNECFAVSPRRYYCYWIKVSSVMIVLMLLSTYICKSIVIMNGFIKVLACLCVGMILSIVTNTVLFRNTEEFKYMKTLAKSLIKKQ